MSKERKLRVGDKVLCPTTIGGTCTGIVKKVFGDGGVSIVDGEDNPWFAYECDLTLTDPVIYANELRESIRNANGMEEGSSIIDELVDVADLFHDLNIEPAGGCDG